MATLALAVAGAAVGSALLPAGVTILGATLTDSGNTRVGFNYDHIRTLIEQAWNFGLTHCGVTHPGVFTV